MRRVRYSVASSLDGYIAGPKGEIDWIVPDPEVDMAAAFAAFDTVLLGRRTYELTRQPGAPPWPRGWRIFVFSRTLAATDDPAITVVASNAAATVTKLRQESGADIWLFGGGALFSSLLAFGVVDEIEVSVMPVMLGAGVPLAADGPRSALTLRRSHAYKSGVVSLRYEVKQLTRSIPDAPTRARASR
jgi:dihydrofolate reductase